MYPPSLLPVSGTPNLDRIESMPSSILEFYSCFETNELIRARNLFTSSMPYMY
jgi:hypothetical protein